MFKSFLMQFEFLTIIPNFFKTKFNEKDFIKGIIFAPLIGFIIGLIIFLIHLPLSLLNNKIISSAVIVFLYAILSGGLHLDGLADTFDGIFSNKPKDKILKIMKEPTIGAFGILALIFTLLLKFAFLTGIDFKYYDRILISMPILSRFSIIYISGISNYAGKTKSLSKMIVNYISTKQIIISLIITIILTAYFLQILFFIYIIIQLIFLLIFKKIIYKKINGITGDIIGASIELTEVIFLFISIFTTNYWGFLWVKFF